MDLRLANRSWAPGGTIVSAREGDVILRAGSLALLACFATVYHGKLKKGSVNNGDRCRSRGSDRSRSRGSGRTTDDTPRRIN